MRLLYEGNCKDAAVSERGNTAKKSGILFDCIFYKMKGEGIVLIHTHWRKVWIATLAVLLLLPLLTPAQPTVSAADGDTAVLNTGFEDGTAMSWYGRGGVEQLKVIPAAAHSGQYGLAITGRTQSWHGPQLDIKPVLEKGQNYTISAWLKLPDGEPSTSVSMSVQQSTYGGNEYKQLTSQTVAAGTWTELKADYTLPDHLDGAALYFEASSSATASFDLDDVTIKPATVQEPEPIQQDIPSLKDVYAKDFKIGSALLVSEIADPNGPGAQLLKKHFNMLTAGNELKWDATEPQEGKFDFTRADQIVKFALDNGMDFRGHTLAWHSQTPDWVFHDDKGNLVSKEVLLQRLKRHIDTVVGRYKGKIGTWDVVNEVIDPSQPNGLRNSLWYQIAGEEYIEKAFIYAHEADPAAKLFINDYNTEEPAKRDALYSLIKRLQAKGIPVDGVGHQMHISITSPSTAAVDAMFSKFADLGIQQEVTELDMSVYSNDTDSWQTFPVDQQIRQAYRYRDMMNVFLKYKDQINAIIFWGKDDGNTWLTTFPTVRNNWPLLFDAKLQAKYAYWALVDPSKVPIEPKKVVASQGNAKIDGVMEQDWNRASLIPVLRPDGSKAGDFRLLWDANNLYLLADVNDTTVNGKDSITVYMKNANSDQPDSYEMKRSGAQNNAKWAYRSTRTSTGYRIEAKLPASGNRIGTERLLDLVLADYKGNQPTRTYWSDTTGAQATQTADYGRITLQQGPQVAKAIKGTLTIDGKVDTIWQKAPAITTSRQVSGTGGSTAQVRTMWDGERLYILAEVKDKLLSASSANAYEQDSIEIFVDPNQGRTPYFEPGDDGQYRINYKGVQSVNPADQTNRLKSAAEVIPGGYRIEASIDWPKDAKPPVAGQWIGFDIQVNNDDTGNGKRDTVTIWNDLSGQSYQNTAGYGLLQLQ